MDRFFSVGEKYGIKRFEILQWNSTIESASYKVRR
jgi:hypothetical protein